MAKVRNKYKHILNPWSEGASNVEKQGGKNGRSIGDQDRELVEEWSWGVGNLVEKWFLV